MTKPIIAERFTATSGFRVSLHNGQTQIEVREFGRWKRIWFGTEEDSDALASTIDDAKDAKAQKGRARV